MPTKEYKILYEVTTDSSPHTCGPNDRLQITSRHEHLFGTIDHQPMHLALDWGPCHETFTQFPSNPSDHFLKFRNIDTETWDGMSGRPVVVYIGLLGVDDGSERPLFIELPLMWRECIYGTGIARQVVRSGWAKLVVGDEAWDRIRFTERERVLVGLGEEDEEAMPAPIW